MTHFQHFRQIIQTVGSTRAPVSDTQSSTQSDSSNKIMHSRVQWSVLPVLVCSVLMSCSSDDLYNRTLRAVAEGRFATNIYQVPCCVLSVIYQTSTRYLAVFCQTSTRYLAVFCQSSTRYLVVFCQSSTRYLAVFCQISTRYLAVFCQTSTRYLAVFCQSSTRYLAVFCQTSTRYLAVFCQTSTAGYILMKILRKQSVGNLMVSPLSLKLGLAMLYLGARGSTEEQIRHVLHLPHDQYLAKMGFRSMVKLLEATKRQGNTTLRLTTRLYIEQRHVISQRFKARAHKYFLSDVVHADFRHHPEDTRRNINYWVQNQTRNTIQDLLSPGTIDSSSEMVLVNTLYMKAAWKTPFPQELTSKELFHVSSDVTKQVDMMKCPDREFHYANFKNLDARVLEVPYLDPALSLVVMLPNKMDGLSTLEDKLSRVDLGKIECRKRDVIEVWLPRFTIQQAVDFTDVLIKLGVVDLFDAAVNLTRISPSSPIMGHVVQKSFIQIDEEGTSAAAATAGLVLESLVMAEKVFKADHPFLFFIRENNSRAILFLGRYTNID
uniref:Serpin domain-containing protein n=1 Tax=Timema genevievae TaxID=629358 RepID=A0A7R9PPB4_TIMGE|nr:unnamed protein product [Timema genevievae]